MARILYGVMGNTNGHIMRSLALARRLPEHEFHFIGGGRVPNVLGGRYPVLEVPVLRTVHGSKSVSVPGVVGQALSRAAEIPGVARRIEKLCGEWQPDLIIADREFFLPIACKWMEVPCLALNHSGLLLSTDYPVARDQWLSWFLAMVNDRILYDFTDENWSVSFYQPPLLHRKHDRLFPPVLREEALARKSSEGDHVLVYQTSSRFEGLLPLIKQLKRPVKVYGASAERAVEGHVEFCPYDPEKVLDDLASCAYVVMNGGHNLLSEAFYLGKPALCFPFGMLFEQFLNAWHVREMGYGDFCTDLALAGEAFDRMEREQDRFAANIQATFRDGTGEVVAALRERLAPVSL